MSRVIRPVFIFLLTLAFIFTLVGFLTPGWKSYKTRDGYVKATIGLVAVALFLEVVALVWLIFTFCRFCANLHLPLVPILVLASLLLLIGLIVFGVGVNSGNTEYMLSTTYEMNANVRIGYSWYISLVGFIFLLAATLASGAFSSRASVVDP